jgi:hypothetical protein
VEQNFVEDTRTTVLQRYFLLTFTYNLRSFGGAQQQNNRIPGMRESMRMFRGNQ